MITDATADDQPTLYFPLDIGEYEHFPLLDTGPVVEAVADLFGMFGAECADRWITPGPRGSSAVNARLGQLSKRLKESSGRTPGNIILHWMGHGFYDSDGVHLAVADSELDGHGFLPDNLLGWIAGWRAYPAASEHWAIVIIDACASDRFVELLAAEAWRRRQGPTNVLLVATARDGSTDLGRFRDVLSTVLTKTYWAQNTISLYDLSRQLSRNLHGCPAPLIRPDPETVLVLRRPTSSVASIVSTSLDQVAAIEDVLDTLSPDERGHFLPKASGAELGDQNWYFEGREAERAQILDWLRDTVGGLLIVTGAAGSGKSALLGHVVVRVRPELRTALEGAGLLEPLPEWQPPDSDPLSAVLHLSGMAPQEVVTRIARAAGFGDPPAHQLLATRMDWLVDRISRRQGPFTILADALDEAHLPLVIARHVLRRLAAAPRTRVIVGTRRSTAETIDSPVANDSDLLDALGGGAANAARVTAVTVPRDPHAMARYVRRRLGRATETGQLTLTESDIGHIAAAIGRSDQEFLFARLAVHEIIRSSDAVADLGALLAGDHRQLFARAVDRLAAEQPGSRELLRALALAQGQGLPIRDGVWRSVAAALGHEPLDADDSTIAALLDAAGPYLTIDVESDQTVYRLAHRTFNEHFLAEIPPSERVSWHERTAKALITLVSAEIDPVNPYSVNPYIVRHLAGHVAEAGAWELLAEAPGVLDWLDPQSVAAEVPNAGLSSCPAPIAATAAISDLLSDVPPDGRALMRAVEMARHWDASPEGIARTQAQRRTGFRLVSARTPYRQPYTVLSGRSDSTATAIAAVRMPDDRTLLAVGHQDGTVELWNPFTGRAVGEPFAPHKAEVTTLATVVQRSGTTLLASGGTDGALCLWDTQRSQRADATTVATSVGEVRTLIAVALHDGRTLLAHKSRRYNKVRLWDPVTERRWDVDTTARGHSVSAMAAVPQADGTTALATGGNDQAIRLWDPLTGQLVRGPLHGHRDRIHALLAVPMPSGHTLLASSSWDDTIRLWDPDTGDCVADHSTAHKGHVTAMAAVPMPDGSVLLATGGSDHTVRLSDPLSGEARFSTFTGHEQDVVSLAVIPSSDPGQVPLIASHSRDGIVCLWYPGWFRPQQQDGDHHASRASILAAVEVPHRGPLVVSAGKDDPMSLWNPRSGRALGKPIRLSAQHGAALAVTRVPGGPVVAALGRGSMVQLWDLDNGRLLTSDEAQSREPVTALALAPLPDGNAVLATATEGGAIQVSVPATGITRWELPHGYLSSVRALCALSIPSEDPGVNPSLLLAGAGDDRDIHLWDLMTGTPVRGPLSGHTDTVTALAAMSAPDGQVILASGGADATVRFWDPASGHPCVFYLADMPSPVVGMAPMALPSGQVLLAVLDKSGVIHLLDPLTGVTMHEINAGARVESITVAGTSLVAGGKDGLFFFDLDAEALPPPGPAPAVPAAAVSDRAELADADSPAQPPIDDPLDYSAMSGPVLPDKPAGGPLPGILAGVIALRDSRWDKALGLDRLDPVRADEVRRWLRLAVGPDSGVVSPPARSGTAARVRNVFRSLGKAALALDVHTRVALEQPDREAKDRVEEALRLVHPVRAALDAALRGTGTADLQPFREFRLDDAPVPDDLTDPALPVLGVVSFLDLSSALASFLSAAYPIARKAIERTDIDTVTDVLDRLDEPPDEPPQRPPVLLPRRTMGHADTLARRFGLDNGNDHFRQALIDPSWSGDGEITPHGADSNAGLAVLGAFVIHSLALRAAADALLAAPVDVLDGLPRGLGTRMADLIPLFTDLGLDDALVYSSADPSQPPAPQTMATAVMAVFAAAYLSHNADLHRLVDHLPEAVAEWLRLGVLAAVPVSAVSATESYQGPSDSTLVANEPAAPIRRKVRGRAAPRKRGKRELVFPRQPGEIIMIGDRIVVQVSRILADNRARLRVDAPSDVTVLRYELWRQRRDQRRRSVPREALQPKPEKQRPSRPPQTGGTGGLFITRNRNETVMIGDEIAVRVIDISGQTTVRLGVEAPEHLPVKAFEVWQQQRDVGPSDEEQP